MAQKDYQTEIEDLNDQLSELTAKIKDLGKRSIREASNKVSDYAEEAGEVARNAWQKTKQGAKKTQEYVEDHPWQSLAAGAVLGFLVGLMVARKNQD